MGVSAMAGDDFITRNEFSERIGTVESNLRDVDRDVVEVKTMVSATNTQMAQILANQENQTAMIQKQGSLRAMVIAGFSGLGGGCAAGAIYMIHWLSQ